MITADLLDTVRHKLKDGVPLIGHMGVDLVSWRPGEVVVSAPLAPNLNTHGTAFGGSLYCVCTMAGWAMTHLTLMNAGFAPSVWVLRAEIEYVRPVRGDLRAVARLDETAQHALCDDFATRGKARAKVVVAMMEGERECVRVTAEFAAVTNDPVP